MMNRTVGVGRSSAQASIGANGGGAAAASTVTRWLSLAATPVFAGMALLTGLSDADTLAMLCVGAHAASPFTGMTAMYGLMAVIHAGPWLRLGLAGRQAERR